MSLFTRASALLFVAVGAAIPFAGCSGGASSNCSHYCKDSIVCATPEFCTLVDPGGAEDACVTLCEGGFTGLSDAESKAVNDCLACILQQNPGDQCIITLPHQSACDAACNAAAEAAGEKWAKNVAAQPPPEAGVCTNGRQLFGPSECDSSSDGTTCSTSCCNGTCGATPTVGVTCDTTNTPSICTCTAGKNKGKTFTAANAPCDGNELWNQCNL